MFFGWVSFLVKGSHFDLASWSKCYRWGCCMANNKWEDLGIARLRFTVERSLLCRIVYGGGFFHRIIE
jgi:hypothetical protein